MAPAAPLPCSGARFASGPSTRLLHSIACASRWALRDLGRQSIVARLLSGRRVIARDTSSRTIGGPDCVVARMGEVSAEKSITLSACETPGDGRLRSMATLARPTRQVGLLEGQGHRLRPGSEVSSRGGGTCLLSGRDGQPGSALPWRMDRAVGGMAGSGVAHHRLSDMSVSSAPRSERLSENGRTAADSATPTFGEHGLNALEDQIVVALSVQLGGRHVRALLEARDGGGVE